MVYTLGMTNTSTRPRLSAPAVRKVLAEVPAALVIAPHRGTVAVNVSDYDPATIARVLGLLRDAGYRVDDVADATFLVER